MRIELKDVTLLYQDEFLLENISCVFKKGSVSCLLGKSGSGKTTILKMIAGLESNYFGNILLNNKDVRSIPNNDRNIGWVPQQQLLFPNKNVRQNVEFGMRVKNWNKSEMSSQLLHVSELTGIQSLLNRNISRLSGGEKQRVALARALAPNPDILLLDEPFSSLDAPERERFALLFREIQLETGITTIHVTHSHKEAEIMSDHLYILVSKNIAQSGTIRDVISNPKTVEIAQLLNIPNVIRENELGEHSDILIPRESITIKDSGIEVKVISVTYDSIYLITANKTILEMSVSNNIVLPGQKVKIQIDFSSSKTIGH